MVKLKTQFLDLDQTAASGQCFTWRRLGPGRYHIAALGRELDCAQEGDVLTFFCPEEEFQSVWRDYFDLDTDYSAFLAAINPADPCLTAAARMGRGIRILRQDLWEVMVSFVISQNNNIARITRSVEGLRRTYGQPLPAGGLAFPGPDALLSASLEELSALGLGYRARYLSALAEELSGGALEDLREGLDASDDAEALAALTGLYGIGAKVASCILLFGLHRLDAFPRDTHINQILTRRYPEGFPFGRYRGFLGVVQQYLFYYDLHCGG